MLEKFITVDIIREHLRVDDDDASDEYLMRLLARAEDFLLGEYGALRRREVEDAVARNFSFQGLVLDLCTYFNTYRGDGGAVADLEPHTQRLINLYKKPFIGVVSCDNQGQTSINGGLTVQNNCP